MITWQLENPFPNKYAAYLVIMLTLHFPDVHVVTDTIGRIIGLRGSRAGIQRVLGRQVF